MTIPRSFTQLALVALLCCGPFLAEAVGSEHRSGVKRSESRPTDSSAASGTNPTDYSAGT